VRRFAETAPAVEKLDFVLLEEIEDAVVAALHHLVLALQHRREVEVEALHLDAVLGEVMPGLLVVLGGLQQRLGGNAADVGAGAAEGGLAVGALRFVDARRLQPQLSSANRCNISAGASSDHHYVERFHISRIRRAGSSSASLIATR